MPSPIVLSQQGFITSKMIARFSRDPLAEAQLNLSHDAKSRIHAAREQLKAALGNGGDIYGASTGFGSSSHQRLSSEHGLKLQDNLMRYHGCGVGPLLREDQCGAALLVRLNCLIRGASAVSLELLEQLERLVARRLFPAIPALGSVGASGDLTPLSYIAAALVGERDVYENGIRVRAAEALARHGIAPYAFKEREALALMNGTSVMSGIAALGLNDARALADHAATLTGLIVELLGGRASPFMPELSRLKPHPGQAEAAARILALIEQPLTRLGRPLGDGRALQDCYSLRCAPQVIGVLYDALTWAETLVECEINSVNDNPVFLPEEDLILNGGLFFGGHIAIACDAVKAASIAVLNLMDRQLALLMEPQRNGVLPENLVAVSQVSHAAGIHHGFKAMQITLSALAAEAQKNAFPASVLSRPTEASNQDVVSMGTIAARDLDHVLGLAQCGGAIHAMAIAQGFFVLSTQGRPRALNDAATAALGVIGRYTNPVVDDRALDHDISQLTAGLFERPPIC